MGHLDLLLPVTIGEISVAIATTTTCYRHPPVPGFGTHTTPHGEEPPSRRQLAEQSRPRPAADAEVPVAAGSGHGQ
jgi:hypothetical protein